MLIEEECGKDAINLIGLSVVASEDWRVEDDGFLVVRVAEVGREVRLQVFDLARLRLPAHARHVHAGPYKMQYVSGKADYTYEYNTVDEKKSL